MGQIYKGPSLTVWTPMIAQEMNKISVNVLSAESLTAWKSKEKDTE